MKTTVLSKKNEEVGNYYGIRTLLVNGANKLQRELEDGKYIVLQAHSGETRPVFAFEVDMGNFRIRSIDGSSDLATLAAQVWHLRFSTKQKTALKKCRQLQEKLIKLEREIIINIKRSESVKR